eukprot:448427-Amphidinium_carterae.1
MSIGNFTTALGKHSSQPSPVHRSPDIQRPKRTPGLEHISTCGCEEGKLSLIHISEPTRPRLI